MILAWNWWCRLSFRVYELPSSHWVRIIEYYFRWDRKYSREKYGNLSIASCKLKIDRKLKVALLGICKKMEKSTDLASGAFEHSSSMCQLRLWTCSTSLNNSWAWAVQTICTPNSKLHSSNFSIPYSLMFENLALDCFPLRWLYPIAWWSHSMTKQLSQEIQYLCELLGFDFI